MKLAICWLFGWMLSQSAAFGAEIEEQRTTLTIQSDGSCQLVYETLKPRALAERQLRAWQDSENARQNAGHEDASKQPQARSNDIKPFTDVELAQIIRERTRAEDLLVGPDSKIELLEVKPETVRLVKTRSYGTLPEMVSHAYGIWAQAGLAFQNIRFEKDADGHLRITHLPGPGMPGYTSSLRGQWERLGFKSEFKLVLPGRILSSGLGPSKDNVAWIIIDGQNSASREAALKLFDGPMVITSEIGGLKINEALESKTLHEQAWHGGRAWAELAIAEAGPGFTAEPLNITTYSVHVFPQASKQLAEQSRAGPGAPRMVILARLFAPKGRTFQSVSGARVIKATDDKGQTIAPSSEPAAGAPMDYNWRDSRQSNSVEIQLQLALPAPDARAIEELTAEVAAVTTGTWKEFTVTNLHENADDWIDLASVLPGASLTVAKLDAQALVNVEAKIKGPPAIRQFELRIQVEGRGRLFKSSARELSYTAKGEQSTRMVAIKGYGLNGQDRPGRGAISLVVRSPQDQRRERVRFKLRGLELTTQTKRRAETGPSPSTLAARPGG